ncbi:hypothetical protein CAPTEDRAFT_194398 [Capitella teleta]|uniref:Transposable element P transposase-like RNase H domain-containing protein n=1 Tax=Capitella teleta TaxID=283909 RepID=R7V3E8_CAPTE|nr:hypothetical protein CAPTEDRAFT_194398 [Capitella teleta]|eukprot:ELU13368.1 hypothetical protein CAPTEDRAFT_194398 [Capitella teleta]
MPSKQETMEPEVGLIGNCERSRRIQYFPEPLEHAYCGCARSYAQWRDLGIMTLPKKSDVQLASHVLQILFLSHSGFRFPVAHYPTHETQAPELFHVIWEAIDKLDDWGFKVEYLCQDGAVANRQLVQIFCAGKLPRDVNFTEPSMLNPTQNMVFIVDPKHTYNKIRNGLFSSGSIRQLTLPHLAENSTVLWKHWRAAYQWDTEKNPLPIHWKLTPAHMQPDSSEKMRNHLAEEVLDKNMLLLMKIQNVKLFTNHDMISRFATDQEPVKSRRESERRPTQEMTGDLKRAGRLAIRHSNSHRSNRNKNMERGGVLHLSTLKIMTLTGLDLCPESSRWTCRCPQHIQPRKEKDLEEDASFHRPAPVM